MHIQVNKRNKAYSSKQKKQSMALASLCILPDKRPNSSTTDYILTTRYVSMPFVVYLFTDFGTVLISRGERGTSVHGAGTFTAVFGKNCWLSMLEKMQAYA